MDNLAITYQHIADILSFETSNSELEKTLSDPSFNWDFIVIEGSKHLVLPALYCRLRAKQLLHLLPEELYNYLEDLTSINRNRNKTILKQVQDISQLLNAHDIEHVFLKGAALLALGCYEDNAERMVGDIDILVKHSQIHDAFHMLKSNGYNKTFGFAYETKDFRHLDRLISDNQLAAIELHYQLLNKKHWSLIDIPAVLSSRVIMNTIAIPNAYYLSKHHILGWQLNDNGHYYNVISIKSIYDLVVLNMPKEQTFILDMLKLKYGQSYLELAKYYFTDFAQVPSNNYMKYIRFSHKILMSFKPIRGCVINTKRSFIFISSRLYLVFTNRSYTTHIIKKLFFNKKTVLR